jgi:hypothetical protein
MHRFQLIVLTLFILALSPGRAVVGPAYMGHPDDGPSSAATPPPAPAANSAPAPIPTHDSTSGYESVNRIKGIGQFTFGAQLKDFPPGLLRPVDPRAHGILLRVSPYGDNYLVTDVSGLTWGNIPLLGLVVTFHDGTLIDLQIALKATKGDFYVADRAFKQKYGPNNPRTLPVETWDGSQVQVTLIFGDAALKDETSLDATARGKVELFNQGMWNKFAAARNAKLKTALDQRYDEAGKKVITNL